MIALIMTLGVLEGILLETHDSLGGIDPHIIGHALSGLIGATASLLVAFANRHLRKRTHRRIYAVLKDMRTDMRRALAGDRKEETPAVPVVEDRRELFDSEGYYWHLLERLDQLEGELLVDSTTETCDCVPTMFRP